MNFVVLPTFNEKDNIGEIVLGILGLELGIKIIVVDDNSFDGTKEILKKLAEEFPQDLEVLYKDKKRGLGSSYIKAFKHILSSHADVDSIITMDADLSHDPRHLPELLKESVNYDFIIGSRYIKGISVVNWPLGRLVLSIFANRLVKLMLGIPINDVTSGFVCYTKKALGEIGLEGIKSDNYAFQIEMKYKLYKNGLSFKEIPIVFVERRYGESKLGKKDIFKTMLSVLGMRIWGN